MRARDVTGRRLTHGRRPQRKREDFVQAPRRLATRVPIASLPRTFPTHQTGPGRSHRPRRRGLAPGPLARHRGRHRPPPTAEAHLHPDHRHRGRLLRVSPRRALPQAQGTPREARRTKRSPQGSIKIDDSIDRRAPSRRRLDRLPPPGSHARHVRLPRLQRDDPDLPRSGGRDGTLPVGTLRQPVIRTRVRELRARTPSQRRGSRCRQCWGARRTRWCSRRAGPRAITTPWRPRWTSSTAIITKMVDDNNQNQKVAKTKD